MKKEKLFKYCTIPVADHWEGLLTTVKFTKLRNLNDPFEGFHRVRDEAGNIQKQVNANIGVASFTNIPPRVLKKNKGEDLAEEWSRLYMWSHYSNSMNGICIEYEVDEGKVSKGMKLGSIEYLEAPPKTPSEFHKHQVWQIEQEFRFSKKNKDILEFVDLADCGLRVKSIYLGVKILGQKLYKKERVEELFFKHPFVIFIKNRFKEIDIFICVRSSSSYDIVRLKSSL